MRRERSLDLSCQRLMKLGGAPLGQRRVFVAFGDGSRCSTGVGHSPAPQARVRQRLSTTHGARVTLVHEAFTSQVCSRCFLRTEGKQIGGKKVHGVMVCRNCYSADRHPLHWLASPFQCGANMVAIYQHLASERLRPTCFTLSD
uniref:Uncharacterized protein n=1 Tax=viral metagenome TaxID=1070528 RepID=A0A6C0C0N8_9ZZZZ